MMYNSSSGNWGGGESSTVMPICDANKMYLNSELLSLFTFTHNALSLKNKDRTACKTQLHHTAKFANHKWCNMNMTETQDDISARKGSNVIYVNGLWPEVKGQYQDRDIELVISDFFKSYHLTFDPVTFGLNADILFNTCVCVLFKTSLPVPV